MRERLQMSQRRFAEEIGTSERTVRRWEAGYDMLPIYRKLLNDLANSNRLAAKR